MCTNWKIENSKESLQVIRAQEWENIELTPQNHGGLFILYAQSYFDWFFLYTLNLNKRLIWMVDFFFQQVEKEGFKSKLCSKEEQDTNTKSHHTYHNWNTYIMTHS